MPYALIFILNSML